MRMGGEAVSEGRRVEHDHVMAGRLHLRHRRMGGVAAWGDACVRAMGGVTAIDGEPATANRPNMKGGDSGAEAESGRCRRH